MYWLYLNLPLDATSEGTNAALKLICKFYFCTDTPYFKQEVSLIWFNTVKCPAGFYFLQTQSAMHLFHAQILIKDSDKFQLTVRKNDFGRTSWENVQQATSKLRGIPLWGKSDLGNVKKSILYVIQKAGEIWEFCLQTDNGATVCVWMAVIRASHQYSGLSLSCMFPLFLSSGVPLQADQGMSDTG